MSSFYNKDAFSPHEKNEDLDGISIFLWEKLTGSESVDAQKTDPHCYLRLDDYFSSANNQNVTRKPDTVNIISRFLTSIFPSLNPYLEQRS